MDRVEELKLKLLVKQAVHEELEDFYRRLSILIDSISSERLTPAMEKTLELLKEKEMTAEDIAKKRNISRSAAVQLCSKLYRLGLSEKVRRNKKVYYRAL